MVVVDWKYVGEVSVVIVVKNEICSVCVDIDDEYVVLLVFGGGYYCVGCEVCEDEFGDGNVEIVDYMDVVGDFVFLVVYGLVIDVELLVDEMFWVRYEVVVEMEWVVDVVYDYVVVGEIFGFCEVVYCVDIYWVYYVVCCGNVN